MGSGTLILFALCITIPICDSSTLYTDVIYTQSGPVRGVIRTNVMTRVNYSAFMGIPYAEPPLERLRFLPPVEIKPWEDVWQATYFRNACPQIVDKIYFGEEDCLYLNVFTPVTFLNNISQPRPVMVWIHGGAFSMGTGGSIKYGPDFLLDKDVILVTFNYRLGPIGFMNMGHRMIPGNAGLKDQNLVLKWVKKNIARFGGDPIKVTLFGQSAGAVSVDLHNIAKTSDGLYQRSIAMSGSVFCPWAFISTEKAVKNALKFADKLFGNQYKYSKESIMFHLKNVPAKMLIENAKSILSQVLDRELEFAPSIEKAFDDSEPFIDKCFLDEYKEGKFNKGNHIMGFTSLEAGMVIENVANNLNTKVPLRWLWSTLARKLLNTPLKEVSDAIFSKAIDAKQEFLMSLSPNNSIYYYLFDYVGNDSLVNGVGHTEDLLYVFYREDRDQSLDYIDKSNFEYFGLSPDAVTRNRVVTMFTNFAKMREPNYDYIDSSGPKIFVWKASTIHGGYLKITNELSMKEERPINDNNKMGIYNQSCTTE